VSLAAGTTALAVYGTLAPGEEGHWVVRPIAGEWRAGTVQGWTFEITWGPAEGYPGFLAGADGLEVPVQVLISDRLDKHWHEIDRFEGDGYERVPIAVQLDDGDAIEAQIYVALTTNE